MYQHVDSGGDIDQVRETRQQWMDSRFHYDFRVNVEGRRIYVETILLGEDPDDPEIQVVNIHDA